MIVFLATYGLGSVFTGGVLYWRFRRLLSDDTPLVGVASVILGASWPVLLPYWVLALLVSRIEHDAQE